MNGERSVRASARCLWACSCGETKIHMGRVWGAYAHILNARAVFVSFFLTIDCLGARVCVCVGDGAAVDVSKAVPSNETSRHTSGMRKETVNGETGVECIHARAPKCAVLVVCASFCVGWWGGGRIQVTGNLHGVIGAWLASALS
jgi:hypothetical protein